MKCDIASAIEFTNDAVKTHLEKHPKNKPVIELGPEGERALLDAGVAFVVQPDTTVVPKIVENIAFENFVAAAGNGDWAAFRAASFLAATYLRNGLSPPPTLSSFAISVLEGAVREPKRPSSGKPKGSNWGRDLFLFHLMQKLTSSFGLHEYPNDEVLENSGRRPTAAEVISEVCNAHGWGITIRTVKEVWTKKKPFIYYYRN